VTAGSKAILLPLWAERAVVAVIVVVILVASLFVTAWPRLVTRVSGEGLQTALTEARPSARSLEVSLRAPEGPLDRHRSLAEEFRDGHMSSTLEMAFPAALLMVESPRLVVYNYPGSATPTRTTDLVLRHYDNADGHITVTSGSLTGDGGTLPMGSGPGCPELPLGTPRTEWEEAVDPDGDWFTQCQLWNIPVIEAAFTSRTLDALGLTVGDRLIVQADVLASGLSVGLAKVVEVSAEIAINNPGDGFWFGDDRLHVPALTLNNDLDIVAVHAVGVFHPSDYQRLTGVGFTEVLPNLYFRHPVDPAAVGPESAARFADDLRAIQLRRLTDNLASASVATGMVPVIEDYLTDRGRAMAVLAASLFGVAAVALGLIWVLAALLHNRNRSSLVLLRSRGGSPGQLVRSQLLQVGMLSIPTVALAYLLSSWLYPTASPLSIGLAVGFGLLVPVSYVAASRQATTADLSSIHEAHQPTGSRRGLLFEGIVAVIAVGAFLLIQRRDPLGSGEADLLVAAVPALAALAAGLLALRLMPALIGLGARVSRRLTGVVVFMGFRRVRQETARFKPAFLVFVLAVALAGFTLATRASIHEDQARAVFVEVGADYRVTGSFPGQHLDVDLSGIAGIEHTAQAAMMPAARSSIDGRNRDDRVNFVGLDAADYASVVADTPIDPGVLDPLVGSDGSGTRDNPIPAVISSDWASIFKSADIEVVALQGLDLHVDPGEIITVIGASGSGKSTLLNVLGGLDEPTAGTAVVGSHDLTQMSGKERTDYRRDVVGFVWQQTSRNLQPYLDARRNVEFPLAIAGESRRTRRIKAEQLLELVGLIDRADHRPSELSGGEQQRVAIAVALANEPQLLLADEPTGELDVATAIEVFGVLRRVNEELGITAVIVTHDPLVSQQVDRTVSIRDGRISSGTVVVDGDDLNQLSDDELVEIRRFKVGFVFQSFGLIPILTTLENVQIPMRLTNTPVGERETRSRELLDRVGLADRSKHRPHELSGGEQQRAAIARALANRPKVLIADEPTGQLDTRTGQMIVELIHDLVRSVGVAVIMATHDPAPLALADRVVELRDGRVLTPA
jgi:ABC-type lipoprotein export system ATPase subunit